MEANCKTFDEVLDAFRNFNNGNSERQIVNIVSPKKSIVIEDGDVVHVADNKSDRHENFLFNGKKFIQTT